MIKHHFLKISVFAIFYLLFNACVSPNHYNEKLIFFEKNINQNAHKQKFEEYLATEKYRINHQDYRKKDFDNAQNIYDTLSHFWKNSETPQNIDAEMQYVKNRILTKNDTELVNDYQELLSLLKTPKKLSENEQNLHKIAFRYALQELEINNFVRFSYLGGILSCFPLRNIIPVIHTLSGEKDTLKFGKSYEFNTFLAITNDKNIGNTNTFAKTFYHNDNPLKKIIDNKEDKIYWTFSEPVTFTKSGKHIFTIALKSNLWSFDVPNRKDTTLFFTKKITVLDK